MPSLLPAALEEYRQNLSFCRVASPKNVLPKERKCSPRGEILLENLLFIGYTYFDFERKNPVVLDYGGNQACHDNFKPD
ncbi:MAG: hypothetical protein AB1629_08270 [Candidatus Omnitrophota bacterium]